MEWSHESSHGNGGLVGKISYVDQVQRFFDLLFCCV